MNEIDLQKHIDEVMDNFDFETTVKMMSLEDLFWINQHPKEERVVALRKFVRESIKDCYERSLSRQQYRYSTSRGGIRVTIYGNTKEDFFLEVEFIGESWSIGVQL